MLRTTLLVAVLLWLGPFAPAQSLKPSSRPRGLAILSSAIGREVSASEVETIARELKIGLVTIDFAWITHHWRRTDLAAVEKLACSLERAGVVVAAMYRPRALRPKGIEAHFAQQKGGGIAKHHNDLCFAHEDSVRWGASWGTRILEACPAIDNIILYNLRATCRCTRCARGKGARHATDFVRACRRVWAKVRPEVRIGHVGGALEHAAALDFFSPFLSVNRNANDQPVAIEPAVKRLASLRPAKKPFVPLVKVCWASATRNTTEDVIAALRSCEKHDLGFLLWYYEWVFHAKDARYDPQALIRALGGDWQKLARFFKRRSEENQERRDRR